MKTIQELNEKKIPIARIDKSLEKYKSLPVFQEKLDKANKVLLSVGPPKIKNLK